MAAKRHETKRNRMNRVKKITKQTPLAFSLTTASETNNEHTIYLVGDCMSLL
jgi:hypothetical protein